MRSVCVVTSTRADFGILTPLLRRIADDESLELRLVVTGTHLSRAFGYTIDEIVAAGFSIACEIPILVPDDGAQAVSSVMANALVGFSKYFSEQPPDMLVLLGDRYEMLAVAAAAVNSRIPIAHIHGGETTEGAADECFRHSITKMSYLHFTACEAYRQRVIQLGESPDRVFNVGALGVENALHTDFLPITELEKQLGFNLASRPYALVTFHPVTLEANTEGTQLDELFQALSQREDLNYIITKANADAGGQRINAKWDAFVQSHANCKVVASLGMRRYMSALKYAACVIGNSSSGIIEAPSFGIPTVNIGDRQRGRVQAKSIINCAPTQRDVIRAMDMALSSEFRSVAAHAVNPYGDGNTSKPICETIKEYLCKGQIDLKKKFYNIEVEAHS